MLVTRGFLQRLSRLQELAVTSFRNTLKPASPLYSLLQRLVSDQLIGTLSQHAYDNIRSKMIHFVHLLTPMLGSSVTDMVMPLLPLLYTPVAASTGIATEDVYSPVAGVVKLLSDNRMIKRLLNRSDSKVHLLYALTQSDRMVTTMHPQGEPHRKQ